MDALTSPPILFFIFGLFAAAVGSNLQIPEQISKYLSLYLLMALGFKGGVALATSPVGWTGVTALGLAMFMALIVPVVSFMVVRMATNTFNAAAIAASYGSVSAVTFVTGMAYVQSANLPVGGYMTVALVLMESPAIVMAVVLANLARQQSSMKIGSILKEAFTDGSHILLLGSMVVGFVTGEAGKKTMDPFLGAIYMGLLSMFLIDMGLRVVRSLKDSKDLNVALVAFGLIMPVLAGCGALALSHLFGLAVGDAAVLAILSASASYIVVPSVVRYAIPEANLGVYFGLSLGVTFPFNIVVGIPLYTTLSRSFL